MSGITKWIIGAVLIIFALLGIKSLFAPNPAEQRPSAEGWEQPLVMPNANLPSADSIDSSRFTRPLNDKPEEDTTVELVGEPGSKEDKPVTATPPSPPTAEPAEKTVTAATPIPEPPANEVTTTPTPAPAAPVQAAADKTGKLEIVAQTESGKPIKANVYVQQSNGTNLDKATYTNKAVFALKPGKYKITVRAEGYASVSRNISVPNGAIVNEIFPLPTLAANTPAPAVEPPRQPAPAPVTRAPTPPAQVSSQKNGKLRVVALSADDGSPLKVNFTIAGLNGSVIDRISNVSLAELTLPPQEVVVSFDLQGFQGYKSLTLQPGQVTTHTFNIRGVRGQAPEPVQADNPPPLPDNLPPVQPQQPQNIEEMIMQKLQEELQKRLTN